MSTALIILNYNKYEDTINCIESVEEFNTSPIKYIVIDNGSTRKNTIAHLNDYFKKRFDKNYALYYENEVKATHSLPYLCLLSSPTNDGYAQGNNKGLKLAYLDNDIDYVMILNNDVLFTEDIIKRLIYQLNKQPKCAIVSPILYKKNMKEIDYNCARLNHSNWEIINTYMMLYKDCFGYISHKTHQRYILKQHPEYMTKEAFEIELPSGSCMLMNKSLMKQLGGFDPNTFLYYEENILFKKISDLCLVNYLIPTCCCIHLGASSTSKSSSYFIDSSSLNSANYYLQQFCSLSSFEKKCWSIAKKAFLLKLHLKKTFFTLL